MDICELNNNPNWRQLRHPWERARVKVIADLLKEYFGKKMYHLHILDIGSGDAYLVYELTRIFPELKVHCVDIEYTPEIKKELSKQIGDANISLYNSQEEYKLANPDFSPDIVLLLDVIEHIEDDRAFLNALISQDVIDSKTKVLITVPAHQSLFSAHDVFLKHFRRYTVSSLVDTLAACNLKPLKSGYFFFSLVSARYIQKKLNIGNDENAQKGISSYKPVFLLDKLIYGTLLFDYYFFKGLRRLGIPSSGLSCYTLCKQKPES